MRPSNPSPSIDSIPTSKRLGTLASEGIKMLQARDLLNDQVTVQPLKVWHPSRLKTGLRNHPIGRKVSIIAFSAPGYNGAASNLENARGGIAFRSQVITRPASLPLASPEIIVPVGA